MISSSLKLARLAGKTLQNKNSSVLARTLAGSVLRQYVPEIPVNRFNKKKKNPRYLKVLEPSNDNTTNIKFSRLERILNNL